MSCTKPKCMLVSKGHKAVFADLYGEPPGKRVTYQGVDWRVAYVPCGMCLACRRDRRMDYTVLQALEASLYEQNWFLTLTYDDVKASELGYDVRSLCPAHVSHFNELMRKFLKYHGKLYRFFGCGEYGEQYRRPHFHLSLFGLTASDLGLGDVFGDNTVRVSGLNHARIVHGFRQGATKDEQGNFYFDSPVIARYWQYGGHRLYIANKDTFQYVAGYVTKKLLGASGKEQRLDGFVNDYCFQSRPSIGFPWYLKFKDHLSNLEGDRLVNDSVSCFGLPDWRIPRVMRRWQERFEPEKYDSVKFFMSSQFPEAPDIDDNLRKHFYNEYGARCRKQNYKHREVQ